MIMLIVTEFVDNLEDDVIQTVSNRLGYLAYLAIAEFFVDQHVSHQVYYTLCDDYEKR